MLADDEYAAQWTIRSPLGPYVRCTLKESGDGELAVFCGADENLEGLLDSSFISTFLKMGRCDPCKVAIMTRLHHGTVPQFSL